MESRNSNGSVQTTLLVIVFFAIFQWIATCSGADDYEAVLSRIRLLPLKPMNNGMFYDFDNIIAKRNNLDEKLVRIAKSATFKTWKTHDDAVLRFDYPDRPEITLEIKEGDQRVDMHGGRVGTADDSFERCYRLVLGDMTYCLVFVTHCDHFDDGICLCGAEVFQKYIFHNGALYRFSLLETGEVKKIQIRSGGVRVMFPEWPHLALHQSVYIRMALSVQLKQPKCDKAAMRESVYRQFGDWGKLGFIEKGMTKAEIFGLLDVSSDELYPPLRYIQLRQYDYWAARLRFKEGKFQGFSFDLFTDMDAARGSLHWLEASILKHHKENDSSLSGFEENEPSYTVNPADVEYIFDRFLALAPASNTRDWERLCFVVHALYEAGYEDYRIVPIIKKRYRENNLEQLSAGHLLSCYDQKGNQGLFQKRFNYVVQNAEDKNTLQRIQLNRIKTAHHYNLPFPEIESLIYEHAIFRSHLQKQMIMHTLRHHNQHLFEIGCQPNALFQYIEEDRSQPLLLKRLDDHSATIRYLCACALEFQDISDEHRPVLEHHFKNEKDAEVKALLAKIVNRLKQQKSAPETTPEKSPDDGKQPEGGPTLVADNEFPLRPEVTPSVQALHRITFSDAPDYAPCLSPDGSHLAYHSIDWDELHYTIHILTLDGPQSTVFSDRNTSCPSWSPDGNAILFSLIEGTKVRLAVRRLEKKELTFLIKAPFGEIDDGAVVSPDGRHIAFHSMTGEKNSVCLVKSHHGKVKVLGPGYSPRWHPAEPLLVYDAPVGKENHLFLYDLQTKQSKQVTTGKGDYLSPTWSPDGNRLAMAIKRQDRRHLYIMNVADGSMVQLTRGMAGVRHPYWGCDGYIYFSSNAGSGTSSSFYIRRSKPGSVNKYGYWDECDIWRVKPRPDVR